MKHNRSKSRTRKHYTRVKKSNKITSQKNTRNKKGGDFVARGAYGCVFRPAIQCDDRQIELSNKVTKVMDLRNARTEIQETIKIDAIDPSFIFHLETPILCKGNLGRTRSEPGSHKCPILGQMHPQSVTYLQLEEGGISLLDFSTTKLYTRIQTEKDFHTLLQGMRNLIEGVKIMKENKMQHFDIKTDNIVLRDEGDSFKVRYIDFGLSKSYQDIRVNEFRWYLQNFYYLVPIEVHFLLDENYNYYQNNYIFSTVETAYSQSQNYGLLQQFIKDGIDPQEEISSQDGKRKIKDAIENTDRDELTENMLLSVDVFSLGIVFLQLWVYRYRVKLDFENKYPETSMQATLHNIIIDMLRVFHGDRIVPEDLLIRYDAMLRDFNPTSADAGAGALASAGVSPQIRLSQVSSGVSDLDLNDLLSSEQPISIRTPGVQHAQAGGKRGKRGKKHKITRKYKYSTKRKTHKK